MGRAVMVVVRQALEDAKLRFAYSPAGLRAPVPRPGDPRPTRVWPSPSGSSTHCGPTHLPGSTRGRNCSRSSQASPSPALSDFPPPGGGLRRALQMPSGPDHGPTLLREARGGTLTHPARGSADPTRPEGTPGPAAQAPLLSQPPRRLKNGFFFEQEPAGLYTPVGGRA